MANTYYVGTGQAQTTIAQVNALSLVAGDSVLFNKGETFNVARLALASGITYSSYGSGNKPVFNGVFDYGNVYGNILSSCTIDGLNFTDGKVNYTNIWIQNCSNITIQNCDFSGSNVDLAIQIYCNSATSDSSNITIDNCTFTAVGKLDSVRFSPDSTTHTIKNSTLSNCTFTNAPSNAVRIYTPQSVATAGKYVNHISFTGNTITTTYSAAFGLQGGEYLTISGNICTNIGNIANPNVNAFQLSDIHYSTIEKNTITTVSTSAPDGVGIILDWNYIDAGYTSHDNIVRKNIVSGCNTSYASGISNFRGANNQIYDNIVLNSQIGISVAGSMSSGCKIYNNTVYNMTLYSIWIEGSAPISIVKNNILKTAQRGIYVQDSGSVVPTEDYNDFYGMTISNFYDDVHSVEVSLGSHSIALDPLLTSDYKLQKTSPCIDAGVNLSEVKDDYDGVPRGSKTDMGCFEFYSKKIKNATIKNASI